MLRNDGNVLLAERPTGKESAGCWEFPGGKFEPGEQPLQALARELREELGVDIEKPYPWISYEYEYANKVVRLHFYRVCSWRGTPHGKEGQRISWQDPSAITVSPLLPANERVLRALNLPSIYAITNAGKFGVAEFLIRLRSALEGGIRLIQVREPQMAPGQLVQFARRVVMLAHDYEALVLINGDERLARQSGADGVHLTGRQLMNLGHPPQTRLWAATCHDISELKRAEERRPDFVVLSPVMSTLTHQDVPAVGWEKFGAMVRDCPLPVFALGGMRLEHLETAMEHGAHGIALLSDIW